jgi:hypothetical protein
MFEDYGNPDQDPGRWRVVGHHEDAEVKVRVRAVPPDVDRSIRRRRKELRNQKMEIQRKGQVTMDLHVDAEREVAIEKACYAVLEFKGLPITPMDQEAVDKYRSLMNGNGPAEITKGVPIMLNGSFSDDLKAHIFGRFPTLRTKILELADAEGDAAILEDEELGKTS